MVSGWLALITTSIARLSTSISGSRSRAATRSMSMGPSMRCMADSAAPRISLFGSFKRPCRAFCTSGVLKRASVLMMCTRAIGSLPCRRPMSSGSAARSAISPMMRNNAAFSFGSWL